MEQFWWKILIWFDLLQLRMELRLLRLLTSDKQRSWSTYLNDVHGVHGQEIDEQLQQMDIYNEAHTVNVGIEIYGEIETTSFLVTMVCFADNIVVASIVCGSYVFVGEIRQRKAQEKKIGWGSWGSTGWVAFPKHISERLSWGWCCNHQI